MTTSKPVINMEKKSVKPFTPVEELQDELRKWAGGRFYLPEHFFTQAKKKENNLLIAELEKHIEHPTKPGYKRLDIVARIKELKS